LPGSLPDRDTRTEELPRRGGSSGRVRASRLLALLPLLLVAGCSGVPPWLTLTWDIIRFSAATIILWGLLFALLGVFAAVGVFFTLRAVKGYRWGWRHARWFRLATLTLMLVALPPLFGVAGALQGAYTAACRILTESGAFSDVYAAVGSVGADVIAAVYVVSPQLSGAVGSLDLDAITLGELETFREGRWEISVPELAARLAGTDDEVLESVVARVSAEARERCPALDGGLGNWVLTTSLHRILLPALKNAARSKVTAAAIPAASGALLEGLADAASSHGSPDTIGRRDLSSHLVRRWIVGPLLLHPFRSLIRGKQLLICGVIGLVLVLPVAFFQVSHAIWRATGGRSTVRRQPEGRGRG
jgi:hypothetical protein